jgi:hypothetical protein
VFGYDIQKVDVYQERFIVARTQGTLMLGDLESCKLSEIPWESDLTERFFFDSDKVRPAVTDGQTVLSQPSMQADSLCLVPPHQRTPWCHAMPCIPTVQMHVWMRICLTHGFHQTV